MLLAKPLLMTVLCFSFLSGCSLPPLDKRTESQALTPEQSATTPLGRAIAPLAAAHPGKSGIHPLANAYDAFAARMMLARAAERSLDVQYYIWHNDMTGTMLLEALHEAAERGVRVRLLLDDNGTSGMDTLLAALNEHPNIEVRLYNPFVLRWPKPLGYVTDFKRLNRRMHNKSFTADNQATIVGGRNIGDEYFGATNGVLFTDLDVLAIGAAVNDVSKDFDRYWASDSAYPVDRLLKKAEPGALDALEQRAHEVEHSSEAAAYANAVKQLPFIRQLLQGDLSLEWADTRMVSDDPRKTLGTAPPEAMLPHQLHEIIGTPKTDLELVSPYFVPTEIGTQAFAKMAQSGVKVQVLTNALEATDVAVVHSGYAKRRKDLLASGVELFEMKRMSGEVERNKSMGPSAARVPACTPRLLRWTDNAFSSGRSILIPVRHVKYGIGLRDRQPDTCAAHCRRLQAGDSQGGLPRLPGRQGQPVLAGTARWGNNPPRHRTGHNGMEAIFRLVRIAAAVGTAAVMPPQQAEFA